MLQIVASLSDNFLVSFMLLESSIMLLENIHSTDVTYDINHLRSLYFIVQATGEGKKLDCFIWTANNIFISSMKLY